eukprot:5733936-Amphidinium_carterae.1
MGAKVTRIKRRLTKAFPEIKASELRTVLCSTCWWLAVWGSKAPAAGRLLTPLPLPSVQLSAFPDNIDGKHGQLCEAHLKPECGSFQILPFMLGFLENCTARADDSITTLHLLTEGLHQVDNHGLADDKLYQINMW